MAGEVHGQDMRDEDAYADNTLEDKIRAHLNAVSGNDDSFETPKPDLDDGEPEADDDIRSSAQKPRRKDDSPSPKPVDTDDEEEAVDDDDDGGDGDVDGDDEIAIDEGHYHAAISAGWTPEHISELLETAPELAKKTFEKLYKDTNELSRRFAQYGRTQLAFEEKQRSVEQQPTAQTQQVNDPVLEQFNKLKADPDYANDPLIGLLENMIKSRPQPQQQTQQPQRNVPSAEEQMELDFNRVQQVATFLNSDRMKTYTEFYGPAFRDDGMPIYDARGLQPGQAANRAALLEEADAIWLGYAAHGKELSAEEALTKAHLNLTESMRSQKVREELIGQVKRRAKGTRLKPSKSKVPPVTDDSKPATEAEFEARTTARLAKLKASV